MTESERPECLVAGGELYVRADAVIHRMRRVVSAAQPNEQDVDEFVQFMTRTCGISDADQKKLRNQLLTDPSFRAGAEDWLNQAVKAVIRPVETHSKE